MEMREIKFEYGFQSVNGIVKKVYHLHEVPNIKEKCDVWNVLPIAYVRQFTGLTDKNGKEIYEGDVVTTVLEGGLTSKGFVRYNSDEWRFEVVDEIPDDEVRYFESIEIIGNIFEQ